MSTIFLDPSNIFIGDRLRALNPVAVEGLKKSISQIGLRTPISVRRIEDEDEPWGLVTGRHRLQACIELGFDRVEAREEEGDERDANLWEIAENLHRAELSLQEHDEHIAEWVRLTEERQEEESANRISSQFETKIAVDGTMRGRPESGVNAAARELGIERNEAHRAVKRTKDIAPEVRNEIRGTKIGDSGVQLDVLAKAKDEPERQLAAVLAVKAGKAKDVRDVLQPGWRKSPAPAPGDPAQIAETDDPPQPVAPAEHSEPEQEKVRAATATDTEGSPLPEPIGAVKVDDELKKWTAAFRSWPWHRQEMALSLIEVDEDSVAALKEDHHRLELKELIIIALKEDISRLEQENRSLRERLASQLDPKPEPDQHREPEEVEPEQAEPVISDVVDEPKPAVPDVTEREPDPKPEPIKPHPLVTKFFDCFASNLLWGQQRLEETPEQHTQIKVRDARWYWLQDFDALDPDTRITVRATILQQDTIDRLAAAGHIVQSPGNPHAYGIPVADPRRREDEDVEETTPPSMAA